jgi:uncharacterized protein involved in type VI secretion and phage assembly
VRSSDSQRRTRIDRTTVNAIVQQSSDPLLATVVGPNGETSASGAGEIHTDRLGRIRIRYEFQDSLAQTQPASIAEHSSNASTWVRVMQRYAGPGMGCHPSRAGVTCPPKPYQLQTG